MTEAQEETKLNVLQNVMEGGDEARCVQVEKKGLRCILSIQKGGTAELQVETGRWVGMKQQDRVCAQCTSGEVQKMEHFLLRCSSVESERETLVKRMVELVDDSLHWCENRRWYGIY